MSFVLSQRSLDKLQGVDQRLVSVVKRAIQLTTVDFGITEGLRSQERQLALIAQGKSQTMNSKHLVGHAVDVVAWVDGAVNWHVVNYCTIAQAFRQASIELSIPIKWGGSWDVLSTIQDPYQAYQQYVALRKSQRRTPFIDAVHFELA